MRSKRWCPGLQLVAWVDGMTQTGTENGRKRMTLGLDIQNTRSLWNGHGERHSRLLSLQDQSWMVMTYVRSRRSLYGTNKHWVKLCSTGLRFILLLFSPACYVCLAKRIGMAQYSWDWISQSQVYYKKCVLELLMRRSYPIVLLEAAENTLALGDGLLTALDGQIHCICCIS